MVWPTLHDLQLDLDLGYDVSVAVAYSDAMRLEVQLHSYIHRQVPLQAASMTSSQLRK